jgi:NAD(P)H-dependent FMN reductase
MSTPVTAVVTPRAGSSSSRFVNSLAEALRASGQVVVVLVDPEDPEDDGASS